LLGVSIAIIASFVSTTTYFGLGCPENKTLMQHQEVQGMSKNVTNIVLVHGAWADGSSWSKEIPILKNAGHKVIAVQLPEHSLADDVDTVKRAMSTLADQRFL
jgi:pimeloyl-ACP methyl ester carboxylesterase